MSHPRAITPHRASEGLRQRIEHQWRLFADDKPGERFKNLHERRQEQRGGAFSWGRLLLVGAGILLVVLGLFFMAVPGPGLPVLVAGLGLLGCESLTLARGLDWAEKKGRPPVLRAKKQWDHLSHRTHLLVWGTLCVLGAAGAALALVWWR